MTQDEIKKFESEWLHEAEIEVSSSLDRECRLGYEWDREIYKCYRNILLDFLADNELSKDDYDALINNINIRHPEDDHDGHREVKI